MPTFGWPASLDGSKKLLTRNFGLLRLPTMQKDSACIPASNHDSGDLVRKEPSHISSSLRRDFVPLIAFVAVAGFYVLALALSHVLPLNAPRTPFLTMLSLLEWRHVSSNSFLSQELVLLGAAALILIYTFNASRSVRIACALTGWLLPLFILWDGVSEIGKWLMAMRAAFKFTYEALVGRGNGQFYGDGPMFIAAVGWWLLLCAVLVFREAMFRSRQ